MSHMYDSPKSLTDSIISILKEDKQADDIDRSMKYKETTIGKTFVALEATADFNRAAAQAAIKGQAEFEFPPGSGKMYKSEMSVVDAKKIIASDNASKGEDEYPDEETKKSKKKMKVDVDVNPVMEQIDEYEDEGEMSVYQLRTCLSAIERLTNVMEVTDDIPEWVQSKITLATDYLDTAADYMDAYVQESVDYSNVTEANDSEKTGLATSKEIKKDLERILGNGVEVTKKPADSLNRIIFNISSNMYVLYNPTSGLGDIYVNGKNLDTFRGHDKKEMEKVVNMYVKKSGFDKRRMNKKDLDESTVLEAAYSPKQQRFFALAHLVRKGEKKRSEVSQEVLDVVDSKMTDKEIRDFAATKHDDLREPKKKANESVLMNLLNMRKNLVEASKTTSESELIAYIENNEKVYKEVTSVMDKISKLSGGSSDIAKAIKLWMPVVEKAIKMYESEYGDKSEVVITDKVKRSVANKLATKSIDFV